MSSPVNSRPTYSPEQIEQYLDYICFPKSVRLSKDGANTEDGLNFLQRLLKYQLSHIPFEDLDMHYSTHHSVSLDPDHLFHKVVECARGRGGYCMQNNAFMGTILRSLGFQVMPTGARVNSSVDVNDDSKLDQARYSGFNHMINIVTIAGRKYFIDAGFGSRGPTTPIPLMDGSQGRTTGSNADGGTLYRLSREHLLDNTHRNPEQLLWVYSIRFHENMKFLPVYCFSEQEFLPDDFAVMSFYTSHCKTSWFGYNLVCQKFILDDDEVVVGDVTLLGTTLKERRYGSSRRLCEIKSESDRVAALETYLDVKLTQSEIRGITNMVSEII